jgi:hypothetical protein
LEMNGSVQSRTTARGRRQKNASTIDLHQAAVWLNHAVRTHEIPASECKSAPRRTETNRDESGPRRPVTPEVAGSSPVAPVARSPAIAGLSDSWDRRRNAVPRIGDVDRGGSGAWRRIVATPTMR